MKYLINTNLCSQLLYNAPSVFLNTFNYAIYIYSLCKFLLQICVHFCLSTFASLISLFACSYNVAFRYWENFERSFFPSTFVMIQESHPYWHTVLNTLSALNTLSCCHIFFNFMWLKIQFATKYYFCLVGVDRDTQKNNNLQLAIYLGMYICA